MKFKVIANNINEGSPLIYMWEIHSKDQRLVGRYVGKAKGGSKRPRNHYKRNVKHLLAGYPYRKSNPDGYRKIHKALAEAVTSGHRITLSFLCNISKTECINEVEQRHIIEKSCRGSESWQLNG